MSQTKIFNFFPGSAQAGSILIVLSSFSSRYKNTYIPHRNIWINKLYFEISNSQEKQYLAIDTHDVNLGRVLIAVQSKFAIIIEIRQT